MDEEKKLNKEQLEAIKHKTGPLLIIAGAGTGKTTVITERIKYLVSSELAKPSEILALTFTDKAAREMEERVDVAMPYGYTQMWISTFHSFCDRILRQEALDIGMDPKYNLMTGAETTQFVRQNLFKFDLNYFRPLGNPNKFIEGLIQHFSRLKDEDVSPEQYLKWVAKLNKKPATTEALKRGNENTEKIRASVSDSVSPWLQGKHAETGQEEQDKYLELARAYQIYEELKIKNGVMDFDDLIFYCLKLLRTRENILKKYQEQFKYILIDEFQDTNFTQNELAILLAGKTANLTVCGDDDQCLPPGAMVSTSKGEIPIKDIKLKDEVVTAVGKGYLSFSKVTNIHKNKKKARFLTFLTESGKKLEATDNHKMFCMVPGRKFGEKGIFYVYLMWRQGMGWRLGITDDLAQRLKLERSADKILAIKSCASLEEARFYENVYALKYQIPTYPFKPRKRMILTGRWLEKLFAEFDTEMNTRRMARDLGFDPDSYHYCLDAVVRGNKERIKIILQMCVRKNRTKWANNRILVPPKVGHEVRVESSSKKIATILQKAGFQLQKARKGWRVRKCFDSLDEAGQFGRLLESLTGGILEARFSVGKRDGFSRPALIMPAKNILVGMHIPVRSDSEIVYEKVIQRKEVVREDTVYDLEVNGTHNFVADGVVVHNSIYRFRGAAVSNIIQFRQNFPKAKIVVLTRNYRSTQEILDRSYTLIQNNNPDRLEVKEKIKKQLESMRKLDGELVEFIKTDRVENEAEQVAKKIATLKPQKNTEGTKFKWSDFAILVRANNHADSFVRALARAGIPHQFLGPGMLFKQAEVKELISYLKLLSNISDSVAMYRVLTMDNFAISPRDIASIMSFAKKNNLTLLETLEQIEKVFASKETKEKIDELVKMIHRHLGQIKKESAGQILYYFLQDSGLLKELTGLRNQDERRVQNISKFFNKLKSYEAEHEDSSVYAVSDWLDLSMEMGESPLAADTDWTEIDAVNILTVHSAKGLEFPYVFLVNLVSQRFPTNERHEQIPIPSGLIKEILPEGDYHLQEERRLFYVGLTRAKDRLFLTASNFYGEGKRQRKISPFVVETLGEEALAQANPSASSGQDNQLSFLNFEKPIPQSTINNQQLTINKISYSEIETFKDCPLHYKLRFILNIPTPSSSAQSFGTSIHATLRDFLKSKMEGKLLTEKDLLEMLESNWISEGYKDNKHEELVHKKGVRMLKDFYHQTKGSKVLPHVLEQAFSFPLGKVKVVGRLDRVDPTAGGKIEIIDYKTGASIPSQKDVDQNLQLTIYALAATEVKEEPFGKNPEEVLLSLHFIETGEKITTTRTREQLEKAKKEILSIVEEIEKSDFKCTPSIFCKHCEFQLLCDRAD